MNLNNTAQRPPALLWKLLVGALVAIGVFGALTYWKQARNDPDAAIDRLADDPRLGRAFKTFQREFPADYAAFKAQAKATAATSGPPEAGYARITDYMRQWVASKRPLIAKADGAALTAVIAQQTRTLEHLRTSDVAGCATFGMNGRIASLDRKDTALQGLIAAAMERTLLAIKSGERAGATDIGAMTDTDQQAFLAALNRRITDRSKLAVLTSGQLTSASPAVQCDVTIAMGDAIGDLPQPIGARVARSILIG